MNAPANTFERAEEELLRPPLLRVEDLQVSLHIRGLEVRAVNGVSFSVNQGKTLGIVGESGSGKSVTARAIMGLLPRKTCVVDGSVRFENQELLGLSAHRWRQHRGRSIALIFQDPMRSLNPTLRIGTQITEALRIHLSLNKEEAKERAIDVLSKVRMPAPRQRFHEYPHQLSGGMRQRVMIAIAISCGPRLLIADEPTTALDVTTQAQVMDLLVELQQEFGMGIILISHDIGLAGDYADEIAVMYAGKIVEQGSTSQLLEHAEMPYTSGLLQSVPQLDTPSHAPLPALGGYPPDPTALPLGCAFSPRCSFADDRCRTEPPPLEGDEGHRWLCWHPLSGAQRGN